MNENTDFSQEKLINYKYMYLEQKHICDGYKSLIEEYKSQLNYKNLKIKELDIQISMMNHEYLKKLNDFNE